MQSRFKRTKCIINIPIKAFYKISFQILNGYYVSNLKIVGEINI